MPFDIYGIIALNAKKKEGKIQYSISYNLLYQKILTTKIILIFNSRYLI